MNRYAAVDIGGTTIKFGVLEESGVFLEKRTCPTPPGEQILPAVLALVEDALKRWPLRGVAVSSTGVVDCETGTIVYAGPTVPRYAGTNFKQAVEAKFGLPCQVENDVNCAGLAEYLSGAGKGSRYLVCLTVGTGVGGCAILHGKVLHGASGSAMEVGYLPVAGRDLQEWLPQAPCAGRLPRAKGSPWNAGTESGFWRRRKRETLSAFRRWTNCAGGWARASGPWPMCSTRTGWCWGEALWPTAPHCCPKFPRR